jgi:hypothetical protein
MIVSYINTYATYNINYSAITNPTVATLIHAKVDFFIEKIEKLRLFVLFCRCKATYSCFLK